MRQAAKADLTGAILNRADEVRLAAFKAEVLVDKAAVEVATNAAADVAEAQVVEAVVALKAAETDL